MSEAEKTGDIREAGRLDLTVLHLVQYLFSGASILYQASARNCASATLSSAP
ncbi:hypothetical protein MUO93_09065 [Candidatus Bathyarchaeota archaeon]|nr:hypothetical protein [Candidatus Bathyarchaeota archaeon]